MHQSRVSLPAAQSINLILFLLIVITITITILLLALGSQLLSLDTSWRTAVKRRERGEVNVLLTVHTDHETWHGGNPLADTDVALVDQNSGVVDGLRQPKLENDGLQTALQEVTQREGQHVIELHLALIQQSISLAPAQQGRTLNLSFLTALFQCQQRTCSTSHLRQHGTDAPDFSLAAETIFTTELQLLVQTLLFEWTTWRMKDFGKVSVLSDHNVSEAEKK
mmetsp:Transcript_6918/g.13141  ORF Transcript_6918/g.13141 Transcript_6918/m.13141 type:complete len:223 (-) Transcript_6918:8-676(-)